MPGTWAVMFCLSGNTPINSSVIVPLELSPMNSNVAVLSEIVISPMGGCVTVLLGIYTFHRQLCYCPVENISHGQLCYCPVWNIFHGQLCYCPVGNISHGQQFLLLFCFVMFYSSFYATYSNIVIVLIIN